MASGRRWPDATPAAKAETRAAVGGFDRLALGPDQTFDHHDMGILGFDILEPAMAQFVLGLCVHQIEGGRLDVLVTLVEPYERRHFPVDPPDPLEAIGLRLDQQGLDTGALVGVIGSRSRVYEVMQGKRGLSLEMIRHLHEKFGIPADVLIRPTRVRPGRRRAA